MIGPEGGSVRIKYEIVNATGSTVTTETWTTLTRAVRDHDRAAAGQDDLAGASESLTRWAQVMLDASVADGTYTLLRYVGTQGVDTLAVAAYSFEKATSAALATAAPDDEAEVGEVAVTVGADGVTATTGPPSRRPVAPRATVPTETALRAPYPNPASGRATVAYELAEAGPVRVAVYDALGREVTVVADGPRRRAGTHVALDASRLPAGVYVVRMTAGAFVGHRAADGRPLTAGHVGRRGRTLLLEAGVRPRACRRSLVRRPQRERSARPVAPASVAPASVAPPRRAEPASGRSRTRAGGPPCRASRPAS